MFLSETCDLLVRRRRSVRAFRPEPVPVQLIESVLATAAESPSNCNTQPWSVEIVSGGARDRLSRALLAALAEPPTPDVPYRADLYPPQFCERRAAHLEAQQEAWGIARDDVEGRQRIMLGNFSFFGAPHVALLTMPAFGTEREAADLGMFAQTFMLALTAHGLASCPQTSIGLYAGAIRRELNVPEDRRILFGISFGHEDPQQATKLEQPRAPVSQWARFHA